MEPHLESPSAKYKESFLAALAEQDPIETSRIEGGNVFDFKNDFDAFLEHLENERNGKNLADGRVPQTVYWLVAGDTFIGRVSIRHVLNDHLKKVGGHIGYSIRTTEREKGYGSLILKLVLPKAKELGIEKALVTCKKTNEASRKIIEKNGGVLENEVISDEGTPSLRFWITT